MFKFYLLLWNLRYLNNILKTSAFLKVPFWSFRVPFWGFKVPFWSFKVLFWSFKVPFWKFKFQFWSFRVPFWSLKGIIDVLGEGQHGHHGHPKGLYKQGSNGAGVIRIWLPPSPAYDDRETIESLPISESFLRGLRKVHPTSQCHAIIWRGPRSGGRKR